MLISCLSFGAFAQEQDQENEISKKVEQLETNVDNLLSSIVKLNKLKVSGYIQTQFQYAEAAADGINFKLAKAANSYERSPNYPGSNDYKGLDGFNRFGVRRGRLKFTYEEGIASGVVQIDITDKGIGDNNLSAQGRNVVMFKDLYLNVKDPWFGTIAFKAGIFDRPFGHEIAYSSSNRESPERSRIIQSIFPDERDLGAMFTLQAAKTSVWNFLKLEAGMFAGNGIKPQIDSHMDFIGHLSATKLFGSDISLSGGVSLYMGGVLQTDSSTFIMKENKFELESKSRENIGILAKRQYIGFDLQFAMITSFGMTQLRGEYIFGKHPGNFSGAYGFNFADITSGPVYMRKISGGYVVLVQDLGQSPVSAVVKYDWYNPNTGVSGNDIGVDQSRTGAGDITKSNVGAGLMWRINSALKMTAYYDFVSNETTTAESLKDTKNGDGKITAYGYEGIRPANVFTLRLQYKF
jgi:hypothetical protein